MPRLQGLLKSSDFLLENGSVGNVSNLVKQPGELRKRHATQMDRLLLHSAIRDRRDGRALGEWVYRVIQQRFIALR